MGIVGSPMFVGVWIVICGVIGGKYDGINPSRGARGRMRPKMQESYCM